MASVSQRSSSSKPSSLSASERKQALRRELALLYERAAQLLLALAEEEGMKPSVAAQAISLLTPRETVVALLFTKMPSDKEVALALQISVWTARNHLTRIRAKLDVQSREELLLKLAALFAEHSAS